MSAIKLRLAMKTFSKLFFSVFICLSAGILGSYLTMDSVKTWYTELNRPSFTPPEWTFGIVWPILYVMMGVSAFLIWNKGLESKQVKTALVLFTIHLILNILWTPLFFGLHLVGTALIEIIFLWAAILLTIIVFCKISKPAALLLIPYILWVSFAVTLNAGFWILNR